MPRSSAPALRRIVTCCLLVGLALATTGCFRASRPRAPSKPRVTSRAPFAKHGVESWSKPTGREAMPDPASIEPSPEEAAAPLFLLDVHMRITHTFTPRVGRLPGTEETHIELTRIAYITRPEGIQQARVLEVVPPGGSFALADARLILPDGTQHAITDPGTYDTYERRLSKPPKAISFGWPEAVPGAIIAWRYQLTAPGRVTFDRFQFTEPFPARRVRYTLRTYAPFEYETHEHGMRHGKVASQGERVEHTWIAHDVPAAPVEPGMAPPDGGRVWAGFVMVGAFGRPMSRGWDGMMEPLRQWLSSASSALAPYHWPDAPPPAHPDEAVPEAWRRVQTGLLPEQGLRPEKRVDYTWVLRNRRASGGERADVLYALLARWGRRCEPVYTTGAGAPPVIWEWPYVAMADHALILECGEVWLDPNCVGCAAGELHPGLRGRPAIRFDHPAQRTPQPRLLTLPTAADPPPARTYALALGADDLRVTGELAVHGFWAATLRAQLGDRPPAPGDADALHAAFATGLRGGRAVMAGLDVPGTPLRLSVDGARLADDGLVRGGGVVGLSPAALAPAAIFDLLDRPERTGAVSLDPADGFTTRLTLTGAGPAARLPAPLTLESPFGRYVYAARSTPEGVVIDESLTLMPRPAVPASEWPALRAFLAEALARRTAIVALRAGSAGTAP